MVRIELLAVGRELLIGRTLNTNAHWIGGRLAKMGTMISMMTTVDDDLEEISGGIRGALARKPRFVVTIGGLGPTPDDMTLEGVARGLGRRVRLNPQAIKMIREHYDKMGRGDLKITPARRKMAFMPSGARPLENRIGTAPGVRLSHLGCLIYCLPGVPAEMRGIFIESVEPEIRRALGPLHRPVATVRIEGVYESALAPFIRETLANHPGAYVKSHPRGLRGGESVVLLETAFVDRDRRRAEAEVRAIYRETLAELERLGGRHRLLRGKSVVEGA